jgi:ligand-binding sensor domain-containing protein/two-component sensor histidine kinase
MRRPLLIPLLMLILLSGKLMAQSYEENGFTRYTRKEGISSNVVTDIQQDSMGYIWVATLNGLNRFDGHFFTSYYAGSPEMPLQTGGISRIKILDQRIIGTTGDGSFIYNITSRRFQSLIIPSDSTLYYWTNSIWQSIRDQRGHYVLSSKTGLYIFDSTGKIINRYDHYQPADAGRVELWFGRRMAELDNGTILQDNDLGFSLYDPFHNKIDTFYGSRHPVLKKSLTKPNGELRATLPGKKGQLFIIDPEKNALDLFNFHDSSVSVLKLPFNAEAEIDSDNCRLIFLGDSLIAITSKVSGFYLLEYHAAAQSLSLLGKKYFDGKGCNSIFKDREDRLWVGTNDGLYKQNLSNPFFKAYDLAEHRPDLKNLFIRAIYMNHSKLFLGLRNKGGILVLDKATYRLEHHLYLGQKDSAYNNIVVFFPYNRDTLWVGTREGLYWLDQNNYSSGRIVVPPSMNWIYSWNIQSIFEDSHKNIWISFGRLNSVVYYDRAMRKFTDISAPLNPLLKVTRCISMGEDRHGNIWLAGDGLCRWNRLKQAVDIRIPYATAGKPFCNFMFILDQDSSNNLWLYTYGNGVIQFNCDSYKMTLRMEKNNFIESDIWTYSSIIRDHIWLCIDNGILAFNIRDYTTRHFSYADDLPQVAVTSIRKGSWYDAEANVLYLGSMHNLISIQPDLSHHSPPKAPILFIDEVITSEGILPGHPDHIDLAYSDNSAQMSFNAINFRNPDDNRFAYRITPSADSAWHMLNWQYSVNFNNLAPGEYHVRLKLFSANFRWPEQVKDLLIIVHPPFWKSTWFITGMSLLVILAIVITYRNRVGQIREKLSQDMQLAEYEMKALHAQMNPHFIFNSLNSIRGMILQEDNRNASRYLARFARLIRLNLEHSKETFITLRQNIEYLEGYLEMEQLRFADFSFSIKTSADIDCNEIRLAPMMIQPLVENAIWHGLLSKEKDKWVRIYFFQDGENLVCEIEDNGIGIRQSLHEKAFSHANHESIGIGNIRQRIEVLNEKYGIGCSLSLKDKADIPGRNDSGTVTTLMLPAHEQALKIYKKGI